MITELKGLIYIAIIFSKTHYGEKGNYYHVNGFIPDTILINVKYIMTASHPGAPLFLYRSVAIN